MVIVKAVIGNISQAKKIWLNEFKIHEYKYEDSESMTEKEISTRTWHGCDSDSDYEDNINFYRRWNNKVMCAIKVERPDISIERYRKLGFAETKICAIDFNTAEHKKKVYLNRSAGLYCVAEDLKDRYKLPNNNIKLFKEHCMKHIEITLPHLTMEQRKDKVDEMIFDKGLTIGHSFGIKDIFNAMLGGCNKKLKNVDKRVSIQDDQYSKDIEEMKNGNPEPKDDTTDEPKDNTIDEPKDL